MKKWIASTISMIMILMFCFSSYAYTKKDIPIDHISFAVYGNSVETMSVSVLGAVNYSYTGHEPVAENPEGGSVKLIFHAENKHYFRITKASSIQFTGDVRYIAASREDNGYTLVVIIEFPGSSEAVKTMDGEAGWIKIDDDWYYRNADGSFVMSNWIKGLTNNWYYAGPDGKLLKNQWVNDTYYMGEDGKMLKNTVTPDGYQVGSDGARVSATMESP